MHKERYYNKPVSELLVLYRPMFRLIKDRVGESSFPIHDTINRIDDEGTRGMHTFLVGMGMNYRKNASMVFKAIAEDSTNGMVQFIGKIGKAKHYKIIGNP